MHSSVFEIEFEKICEILSRPAVCLDARRPTTQLHNCCYGNHGIFVTVAMDTMEYLYLMLVLFTSTQKCIVAALDVVLNLYFKL